MNRLLNTPFLPKRKVKVVAVSYENTAVIDSLHSLNIKTLLIRKNHKLEEAISSHADCMLIQLDNRTLLVEESQFDNVVNYFNDSFNCLEESENIVNLLTNREETKNNKYSYYKKGKTFTVIKCSECISSPYPNDVSINVKIVDHNILCNTKYVAGEILDFALNNNYRLIHCNQGYVGCSTVLIDNNTIITDDNSINLSAVSNGIISNVVSIGQIKLSGYKYGFLGGCCGMIDKNVLAFTGRIEKHKDYNKIKTILDEHNIKYINLTDNELTDIGGIIPIIE